MGIYTGKVSGGICPVSWICTATLLTVCSPHSGTMRLRYGFFLKAIRRNGVPRDDHA